MAHYWLPDATSGTGTGNWSATGATGHWADDAVGTNLGKAAPGSGDDVFFGAAAFNGAGQIVTVDAAASCLSMDWTGATNNPTLSFSSFTLNIYGNVTLVAGMTIIKSSATQSAFTIKGNCILTSNGVTIVSNSTSRTAILIPNNVSLDLADALSLSILTISNGTFDSNSFLVTASSILINPTTPTTLTLGNSTVNVSGTGWTYSGTNLTVTANTATINITGTGALAAGAVDYNGADFNLNGTDHTVSGTFTCATLTRNGTATNANTVTFTSGTTVTCTDLSLIGNSRANQLLAQSSTLGTAATLTVTNAPTFTNVDLMDLTLTNACNGSATTGDAGGNTGVTFTAAAAQTYTDTGDSKASTAANWTSRIPLVGIDDVTIGASITYDMPRMGKSISITAGTTTLSQATAIYGSFTLASGVTYTTGGTNYNEFRGRAAYTLTTNGRALRGFLLYAPNGTYALQDDLNSLIHIILYNGSFNVNSKNITTAIFLEGTGYNGTLTLGGGTITLSGTSAGAKLTLLSTSTLNAGTSTIILTNSGANAQTFAGGGLTYNNVTVTGAGTYTLTITGDNTFEKIINDSSVAVKTITLTPASIQTIRALRVFSTTANVAVFNTGGAAATVKGHRGYCELNHVNLTSIVAGEKYKYYAGENSTDGTGNTNWVFGHKARTEVD